MKKERKMVADSVLKSNQERQGTPAREDLTLPSDFLDGGPCLRLTLFMQESQQWVKTQNLNCDPYAVLPAHPKHTPIVHTPMSTHTHTHTHTHVSCPLSSPSSPQPNIWSILIMASIFYLSDPVLNISPKNILFNPSSHTMSRAIISGLLKRILSQVYLFYFSYSTNIYRKAINDHIFSRETKKQ